MSKGQTPEALKGGAVGAAGSLRRKRKSRAKTTGQIDLHEALHAPVRMKQDGRPLDPYEAILRQHARKSLVGRSVASMKFILDEAERHNLIKASVASRKGGVFVVPKNLPEDIEHAIWDDDGYLETGKVSITRIVCLLAGIFDLERIKRCFNGHRD